MKWNHIEYLTIHSVPC